MSYEYDSGNAMIGCVKDELILDIPTSLKLHLGSIAISVFCRFSPLGSYNTVLRTVLRN